MFKGMDFVRKHLENKHPEDIQSIKTSFLEKSTWMIYLIYPNRVGPQIVHAPCYWPDEKSRGDDYYSRPRYSVSSPHERDNDRDHRSYRDDREYDRGSRYNHSIRSSSPRIHLPPNLPPLPLPNLPPLPIPSLPPLPVPRPLLPNLPPLPSPKIVLPAVPVVMTPLDNRPMRQYTAMAGTLPKGDIDIDYGSF